MAREEDLVGGGEPHDPGAVELPLGAAADLGHGVEAGREQDEDGGRDGARHDGPAPALEAVEREHGELPQRRLEEQSRRHRSLRREHREEELDHLRGGPSAAEGKRGRRAESGRQAGVCWILGSRRRPFPVSSRPSPKRRSTSWLVLESRRALLVVGNWGFWEGKDFVAVG